MATPLGPKHDIFRDTAPKFDNPSKLGSKTNRIHFSKNGKALPVEFSIAVASNKTVGDPNLVLGKSIFDKIYKKITKHDRWVAVNVGTPADPHYIKVNYNSMHERLFNAAEKLIKNFENIEKRKNPWTDYEPITNKDLEDLEKLENIKTMINNLTGVDTVVLNPEMEEKIAKLKTKIDSSISKLQNYILTTIDKDLTKFDEIAKIKRFVNIETSYFKNIPNLLQKLPTVLPQNAYAKIEDFQRRYMEIQKVFAPRIALYKDYCKLKNECDKISVKLYFEKTIDVETKIYVKDLMGKLEQMDKDRKDLDITSGVNNADFGIRYGIQYYLELLQETLDKFN